MNSDPRRRYFEAPLIIAGIFLGALAACDKPAVTYTLKIADRDTLPIALAADSVCLTQLMGGAVKLDNGKFTMDYKLRKVCPTGSTPLPNPGTHGRYEISQGVVIFRDTAGARMNRGEIRGDTMVIPGKIHTLRFVK